MFNLLVSGTADAWEGDDLKMPVDRFNSYSGKLAAKIDVDDPESLSQLDGIPSLVMYELGVLGRYGAVARYGRLRNVARYGQVVTFEFEPDPDIPFLPREKLVDFAAHLDMNRFEQNHRHWAIKDGPIPPALLKHGYKTLAPRSADTLADEYLLSIKRGQPDMAQEAKQELDALPLTTEVRAARERMRLDTGDEGAAVQTATEAPLPPASRPEPAAPDLLPVRARVIVIIVGLETYRTDAAHQIEPVPFARADAEAFKASIETVFEAYRPEVTVLLDEHATDATLRNELKAKIWSLGEEDLFIFYYAGHGFHDASGNRLTVWDTTVLNVDGTTLSVTADLLGPLQASPCQRVIAFVDACASKFKPLGRRVITPLDTAEFGAFLKSAAYCGVFLSCRPGEQSFPDSDLGHGVWTYYLLRALNGQAEAALGPDRYLTNTSLQDYLRQEVPRHTTAHPRIRAVQTPEAVITATNSFAIRQVPAPEATLPAAAPAPAPAGVTAAPAEPKLEIYSGTSTQFFADRFAQAFPGVRGVRWFTEESDIQRRMMRLLKDPITFENTSPVWWWADGNIHIDHFRYLGGRSYLMDVTELEITRIAAITGHAYWGHFVYVEVAGMSATGANRTSPEAIAAAVDRHGYADEEYGLVDGTIPVSRPEFDDGAAEINGELQDIIGRAELRVRYLTPYNFLIAPNGSPINNNRFDQELVRLLRQVLRDASTFDQLVEAVRKLPRRDR